MTPEALFVITMAIPFIAACLCTLAPPESRAFPWIVSVMSCVASLILLLSIVHLKPVITSRVGPLNITFAIDPYGLILAVITLINGLLILIYSYGYLSPSNREHPVVKGFPRYYLLFNLFIGSMLCISFAQDLLTFVLFYELTGLCSCMLIAFYREREHAYNGFMALTLTHVGGLALMFAAALLYVWKGTLSFTALAALEPTALLVIGSLFLIASLAKSAQIPFHHWLPRAMVAPTTVSAYLHAASMVNVGVFTILRFTQYTLVSRVEALHTIGLATLVFALATMFYGAFMYMAQRDLKRLLAYSTIVQLGYMLLAVGFALTTLSYRGLDASMFHMWNHSFAKALLFLSVGAMAYALGRRDYDALREIPDELGLVKFSLGVGAAAIAGLPPLNCFFSKLAVILTGLAGNLETFIASLLAVGEFIITFIVFMLLLLQVVRSSHKPAHRVVRLCPTMVIALSALVVLTLVSPYLYRPLLEAGGW